DEIPPFNITRRTNRRQSVACTSDEGIDANAIAWAKSKDQERRRQSAPVISQVDEFHRKLARLRQRYSLSCAEEEDEETEEQARSRRGSKQAFVNMIEAAKANKEIANSEQQSDPRRRRSDSSSKAPEKNYAHRASIIFIDDNEVSSIHSSTDTPV
uniref:Protein lap4 n=1 Tax=Ascaris lumbricoides TaxID=6252 RepID=A0A0M3IHT1_ASCLU